MDYQFHWTPVLANLPAMLAGCLVTIQITVLSIVGGVALGLLLMLARSGKRGVASFLAQCWVEVARNTPALFQIYMIYFGLGSVGLHLSSFVALLTGITFNNAGYLSETFRGGLTAIPETQVRAARSLGMTSAQSFRYIVLPQLLRIVYYPTVNQMVWAILMTALGLTVGMDTDLAGVTQNFNVLTYRTFEYFSVAAVLYYLVVKLMMASARLLAYRMFRY
jgi:His/Glu/Gln/Arg/opine family amino acid ABC transporter permease subunit